MSNPSTALPADVLRWKQLVLASYYGLIGYFGINSSLAVGFASGSMLAIWLIQVLPLLLFSIGLHRVHFRAYTWLSLAVLLYFIHGVLLAFDPRRLWLGITEVALCVALFVFLMLFIRSYRVHFKVNL